MTEETSMGYSYSAKAFFLISAFFIVVSPAFWLRTELQPAHVDTASENTDLYQEILPVYKYGFGRVRMGELPLWNPKQLCGTPFQANPASALFHPSNLFFAAFPVERAMAVHAFTSFSLMGILFALFLRSFGIGYLPAAIGALAYTFCAASATAASRPAMANVLASIPLVLWGLRHYAKTYRMGAMAVAGLGIGLTVLSGATGLGCVFLAMAAGYALYLLVLPGAPMCPQDERPPVLRRAEALTLCLFVGLALSAVQWLPSLMWIMSLDRPLRVLLPPELPGVLPNSFQEMLAQLLVPKEGTLPRVGYFGVIPLLAIPAAFCWRKGRGDVWFFLVTGGLCLFVAGSGTRWLPASVPSVYLIFPAAFCLATLSGLGFDRLLSRGHERPAARPWWPALSSFSAACILFYVSSAAPRGRIVAFVFLLVLIMTVRARWFLVAVGSAYALFLFADLASANRNLHRHPAESEGADHLYIRTIQAAEEQSLDARVMVSSRLSDYHLPVNLGMIYPSIYGADGFLPYTRDHAAWLRRLAPPELSAGDSPRFISIGADANVPSLINFMCVRAIIAGPDSPMYSGAWLREGPPLREVKTDDVVRLFVNEQALPRVSWAPGWRMTEGIADAIDTLASPEFDPRSVCTVDRDSKGIAELVSLVPGPLAAGETPAAPASPTVCAIERNEPECVVVWLSAAQNGITTLADSFDSGWTATLDGIRTPILRVNGLFRGIPTSAGDHVIEFCYTPLLFYAGLFLSLAALTALFGTGLVAFFRR